MYFERERKKLEIVFLIEFIYYFLFNYYFIIIFYLLFRRNVFFETERSLLYVYICAACFEKVIESLGTLDIVINNAGILNEAEWEPMVDVNYVSDGRFAVDFGGSYRFAVFVIDEIDF